MFTPSKLWKPGSGLALRTSLFQIFLLGTLIGYSNLLISTWKELQHYLTCFAPQAAPALTSIYFLSEPLSLCPAEKPMLRNQGNDDRSITV